MNPFMQIAFDEARAGITAKHGGPFGAVIVRDGEIIAQGHNEVLLRNDPTAHAEVVAIRRACERLGTVDLSDCFIYASAKPCPMCKGAIQWSRIPRVYYSGDYSDTDKLSFDDSTFSDDFDVEEGWEQIDQDQFHTLIDAFEQYRDEIRY
jgi:guanine deaminase